MEEEAALCHRPVCLDEGPAIMRGGCSVVARGPKGGASGDWACAPGRGGRTGLMRVAVVVHVGREREKKLGRPSDWLSTGGVGRVLHSGCDGGAGMTGFGECAGVQEGRNGGMDIGSK